MAGESNRQGMSCLGVAVVFFIIAACVGGATFLFLQDPIQVTPGDPAPAGGEAGPAPVTAADLADLEGLLVPAEKAPALAAPQAYQPKDGVILVELSEYAGYAGLIVANGGLEPNPDSYFTKKHGIKVKLALSENEDWSRLNTGQMAASATTADVLAVYGRQFAVTVPAQIGFSRGADGIVVRNEIRRVNQLQGKVVATCQFNEAEFFLRYLAGEAGLQVHNLAPGQSPRPDAVNLVFCEDAFAAGDLFLQDLKSGANQLAGCVTWAPKTTEVVEASGGKARILVTNQNLLLVADVLIVNKPFAEANPQVVYGLVDGLLEGNRQVRTNPQQHLGLIAKAFKWSEQDAKDELAKVHLSNLPENLAFFAGTIDSAGSFDGIYESAVFTYGREMVGARVDTSKLADQQHLKRLQQEGRFPDEKVAIAPIRSATPGSAERDPLLSRDIRFFFEANSERLDAANAQNDKDLASIKQLLNVSPGSYVLLRGHVDQSKEYMDDIRKQGGEKLVRKVVLLGVELSKKRAETIRDHLVKRHGISADRIETIGCGAEEPVGTDSEVNRRVEVQWFTIE